MIGNTTLASRKRYLPVRDIHIYLYIHLNHSFYVSAFQIFPFIRFSNENNEDIISLFFVVKMNRNTNVRKDPSFNHWCSIELSLFLSCESR